MVSDCLYFHCTAVDREECLFAKMAHLLSGRRESKGALNIKLNKTKIVHEIEVVLGSDI